MSNRKVMRLASRGKRLGAFCIDMAVPAVAVLTLVIISIIQAVSYSYRRNYGFGYGYGYGYGYGSGLSAGTIILIVIMILLCLAYMIVQIVMFTKSRTIGKAALGLQVVSSDNGEPVGFWKMLFREWFVKQASAYVLGLGYIWVLVDEKNRGWHDKILDTYVIDVRESEKLLAKTEQTSVEIYNSDGEADE